MIHVGLPTLVDLAENELPNIKQSYVPKNYELCADGDVAFADASEDTNDVAKAIELINTNGQQVVFGLHTIHGRDNKGITAKGFKGYAFASKVFHDQIKRIAQGTKIFSINSKNFAECYIGVPSLQEQERIAHLLSIIDRRIAVQNKIIERLQSLMGGIVVKHYNNCDEKKQVTIADIGESFTVMNLSKEQLSPSGQLCVLYGELFTTYNCVISSVVSRTTVTDGVSMSHKNDLLFPSSTTVDAISLIAPSAITQDGIILGGDMFGIHINENYNNVYLAYLINYIEKRNLAKFGQGSTIVHLHYNDISRAKIHVPNLEEQSKLVAIVGTIKAKIDCEINLLIKCQQLKEYLLSQMFI